MNSESIQTIKIFISSPGDVYDERMIAAKVIEGLSYDPLLIDRVHIKSIAWDKGNSSVPLLATCTPQTAISSGMPKPSECDIVIVIMGARMGTPLPDEYRRADGSLYLSGTQWEFEDALERARIEGNPEILVYRKTEKVSLDPSDSNFLNNYEQWKKVQEFFAGFSNELTGSISMGYNEFEKPEDFRQLLEKHLKLIISKKIKNIKASKHTVASPETPSPIPLWEGSPFPGLRAFAEKDEPIYFGRGHEVDELIESVKINPLVAIVGVSGSGKSSLVGAGLIPRLRRGAIINEGGTSQNWSYVKFSPNADPFFEFSNALLLQVEPLKGDPILFSNRRNALIESLRSNPLCLQDLVRSTNHSQPGKARLFIFIDQFEELFTLTNEEDREEFIKLLVSATTKPAFSFHKNSMNEGIAVQFIITVRADFYHRCIDYIEFSKCLRQGTFPLSTPSMASLHEMITKPAARAGIVFEIGLIEKILADTGDQPGSLALMAYTLDELYKLSEKSSGNTKLLSVSTYNQIGGVQGAIGKRAEFIFDSLSEDAKNQLPILFQELVSIDHRGIETRERAFFNSVNKNSAINELIDRFTEARLLVQSSSDRGPVIEVAHEALFRNWERLSEWIELTRNDLYQLKQMQRAAQVWEKKGRSRDFLWLGEKSSEIQEVIKRLNPHLSQVEAEFCKPEQAHLLEELEDESVQHIRRHEIGMRIALIGDTRHGVGVNDKGLPSISWIKVPGGNTLFEGKTISIADFYISKFPITYIQYQSFIEDPYGFDNPKWWSGFPKKFTETKMRFQVMKTSNSPRDNVNWFQSLAFCYWLNEVLDPADLPTIESQMVVENFEIRLPTEWEWLHAAQAGNSQNIYPWGRNWKNNVCNSLESGLAHSISVGMYPGGRNPLGIEDLGGNVREWCLNDFVNFKNDPHLDYYGRASKGGSFASIKEFSKCTARYCDDPDEHPSDDGFRVVYSPKQNTLVE